MNGLYFFDSSVFSKIDTLKYSMRNELEMVDLVAKFDRTHNLSFVKLGNSCKWFDCGSPNEIQKSIINFSLLEKKFIFLSQTKNDVSTKLHFFIPNL